MMTPLVRLLLASLGAIYALKAVMLVKGPRPGSTTGLLLFLFAWPGVVPNAFLTREPAQAVDPARFLSAWIRMAVGAASLVLLAVYAPRISDSVLGLAGIAAFLLTLHVGIFDLLPWFLRWAGYRVPLLFDLPCTSVSLTEFWSRRWNLAFVEMNRRLFLRPFRRVFGKRGSRFALFALSGMFHELGISWPAGAGWGLPLAYFLLQAVLVEVEERFRIASRAWTWFWVLAPAPWLFHEPFRRALVLPFFYWLHALLAQHTGLWYLSHALYASAAGHLLILVASFQAPVRLGWKEDIAKLTRFNQKIFWAYGFYILLCIVTFAALTWRLHDAFLAGDLAARYLAGFIAVFWTSRILMDFVWYEHRDWPRGNALLAGHALLTSLFCCLAGVYWFSALAT